MNASLKQQFAYLYKSFANAAISVLVRAFLAGGGGESFQALRVGANAWPGYEPCFLADGLGYYEGTLITFPSAAEVIRAYRTGAIDVAAATTDEAIQISETLPDQLIILVCDFSMGADAILAKPQFQSMQDLRGRRIGVEQNALRAYMLTRALDYLRQQPENAAEHGASREQATPVVFLASLQFLQFPDRRQKSNLEFLPHRRTLAQPEKGRG